MVEQQDRSGAWLGGSDHHHVHSLKPYGCRRRLFYEKRGQKPDFPPDQKLVFKRGSILEPLIANEYMEATGRKVKRRSRYPRPDVPWLRGQPDRHIVANDDGRGAGVLEIKSANAYVFRKFVKEGLPESYIFQVSHYLWLARASWGAFAILQPDSWEFITLPVTRDDDLIEQMREAGEKFIKEVENGPEPARLDSSDARCHDCPYRSTCQGTILKEIADKALGEGLEDLKVLDSDADLEGLAAEYREIKAISDEAEDKLEEIKTAIKARMKNLDSDAIQIPGSRLYHRPYIRASIDSKQLRKHYPKIAQKYTKETLVAPLNVYSI